MGLENILWLAGVTAETTLVGLLIHRRVWRSLPFFFVFSAWLLLSDAGNYVIFRFFHDRYLTVYLIESVLDSVLEFSVLVELAWSVLRPIRAYLSRSALLLLAILILAFGAALWPISGVHRQPHMAFERYLLANLQQTVSILRVLFFLLLAGFSQWLSIGWRDRELQVASGLGFYSLVSIGAAMIRAHQTTVLQYSQLNQVVAAGYVISLLYWVFSFAQKEAARREFTPQMQSFLLAVAGNARATRLAMANSAVDKTQGKRKP